MAADTRVRGYTRKDGTYVRGHYRSDPDSTVRNNWSYRGNINPYTGAVGTNRYYNSPSSEYYRGGSSSSRSYGTYSSPSAGNYGGYGNSGSYSGYSAPTYQPRTYYHGPTKSSYYYPKR